VGTFREISFGGLEKIEVPIYALALLYEGSKKGLELLVLSKSLFTDKGLSNF